MNCIKNLSFIINFIYDIYYLFSLLFNKCKRKYTQDFVLFHKLLQSVDFYELDEYNTIEKVHEITNLLIITENIGLDYYLFKYTKRIYTSTQINIINDKHNLLL